MYVGTYVQLVYFNMNLHRHVRMYIHTYVHTRYLVFGDVGHVSSTLYSTFHRGDLTGEDSHPGGKRKCICTYGTTYIRILHCHTSTTPLTGIHYTYTCTTYMHTCIVHRLNNNWKIKYSTVLLIYVCIRTYVCTYISYSMH